MLLDIKARNLPEGFLVNPDGRISRWGSKGKKMYCGAKYFGSKNNPCESFCGPNNGQNCSDCDQLQQDWNSFYKLIFKQKDPKIF